MRAGESKKGSAFEMTRRDLARVRHRDHGEAIRDVAALILLPTRRKHDSG